jgi:hypothetical protein
MGMEMTLKTSIDDSENDYRYGSGVDIFGGYDSDW